MAEITLDIVAGPGAGRQIDVASPLEIGRADTCGLVLTDPSVSGHHLRVTPDADGVTVEDLGSTNGTFVNGERIAGPVRLTTGHQLRIGSTTMRVVVGAPAVDLVSTMSVAGLAPPIPVGGAGTVVAAAPAEPVPEPAEAEPGDLNQELIDTDVWTDDMIARAGIPVVDIPFVTIGGGVGSFVMVDYLRIAGVPVTDLKVLTGLDYPWQTYEFLTTVSQIPPTEILRSDSASCPDNIWGFPSYAVRSAFDKRERVADGNWFAPLWNVLTENVFVDYWTPKSGQVFRAMQKEADRIDYWSTIERGQVRMVRRRFGGGYFTILTPPPGTKATKRVAYRSRFVHVCVGYPGLKFLDDLQEYRQTYDDTVHVVNAYEPHEHVYEGLKNRPGSTVVVRGAGIVASRVLQRLCDDRKQSNTNVTIQHLFRNYYTKSTGPLFLRRKASHGWQYQGFNFPKACWGGVHKNRIDRLEGQARAEYFKKLGGTTTPRRRLWQKQLAEGRKGGWYQELQGTVESMQPGVDGASVSITVKGPDGNLFQLNPAYVIDCTGLEADISEHRLLADLLEHSGAGRNPSGRLDCSHDFEIRGTANQPGKMYAAGAITLGAYYATVDSFLGLQYACLKVADDLARQGFGKKIGPGRSVSQWLKWMRRRQP